MPTVAATCTYIYSNTLKIVLPPGYSYSSTLLAKENYTLSTTPGHLPLPEILEVTKVDNRTYTLVLDIVYPDSIYGFSFNGGEGLIVTFSYDFSEVLLDTNHVPVFCYPISPAPGQDSVPYSSQVSFYITRGNISTDYSSSYLSYYFNEVLVGRGGLWEEETELDDYKKIVTITVPLIYNSTYVVKASYLQTVLRTWSFSTEEALISGPDYTPANFYYQNTQYMANAFPPESRIRTERSSVAQTFLNQAAPILDTLDAYTKKLAPSLFPSTANCQDLSLASVADVYRFNFTRRYTTDGYTQYVIPSVKGYIGCHCIELEPTNNNKVIEVSERLPNQFYLEPRAEISPLYAEFLPHQEADIELSSTEYHEIFILIDGLSDFVWKDGSGIIRIASLTITGITSREIEETETFQLYYDGVYRSNKKYRKITKIEAHDDRELPTDTRFYFSQTPSTLPGSSPTFYDSSFTSCDASNIKATWWRLTSPENNDTRTVLSKRSLLTFNTEELASTTIPDELFSVYDYLLLDSDKERINGKFLAPEPDTNFLYVLAETEESGAGNYLLHVYHKQDHLIPKVLSDLVLEASRGDSAVDLEIFTGDQTTLDENGVLQVEINVFGSSPINRILHTKVTLYYVDDEGNLASEYLTEASSYTAVPDTGWRSNDQEFFGGYRIDKELTRAGHYVAVVEFITDQGQTGQAARSLFVGYKTPLATYRLPLMTDSTELLPEDIYFNGEAELILLSSAGDQYYTANLRKLHNYYNLDFTNKQIVTPGEYTEIEIEYENSSY